jgi:hypothetical protein
MSTWRHSAQLAFGLDKRPPGNLTELWVVWIQPFSEYERPFNAPVRAGGSTPDQGHSNPTDDGYEPGEDNARRHPLANQLQQLRGVIEISPMLRWTYPKVGSLRHEHGSRFLPPLRMLDDCPGQANPIASSWQVERRESAYPPLSMPRLGIRQGPLTVAERDNGPDISG